MNLNNLKLLLDKRGEKYKLSKETGISTGNIRDWLNPNRNSLPGAESLIKIAEYFDCSIDYILDRTNIKHLNTQERTKYSDNIIKLFDIGELIEIGTYQEPVSAGYGNIIDDSTMKMQFYPQTKVSSQADYCVIVSGDSMFPLYEEGDVLFVKSTNILRNNDIGIFFYDDETVCKRYNNENNVITLISENIDKYKPRIVLPEKLIIRGKVLGKYHID